MYCCSYMKTIKAICLLLFFVIAAVNNIVAQDVMDEIALKCCECISAGDSALDKNELQMKLGLCMIREAMPYKKEIKKKYKLDLDRLDAETGRALGQLVGSRLPGVCPEKFALLMPLAVKELEKKENTGKELNTEAEAKNSLVLQGTIVDVKGSEFATITIKDSTGREQKLLWLEYFEGAALINGSADSFKTGTFKAWYTEREIYNFQLKDYIKYKIITRLEKE